MTALFSGYSGVVWQSVYADLVYYFTWLQSNPSTVIPISEAMLATLMNANDAICANAMARAWTYEAGTLTAMQAMPLTGMTANDSLILSNRTTAYINASAAMTALVPSEASFLSPSAGIAANTAGIPYCGLLEFYESFGYETPPLGLTSVNFLTTAQTIPAAFTDVANAIRVHQGAYLTQIYDAANRQSAVANAANYLIGSFTSGNLAYGTTAAWNQIVTLPSMTMDSDVINCAPVSAQCQQEAVIRYTLLTLAAQIASFLTTAAIPSTGQVNTVTLNVGQTLVDVAAQALGDYTQWPLIASLNNLSPPYVGAVAAPGIAAWGQQLVLPSPNTSSAANGSVISYTNNVLGTDLFFGPINGDMPTWNGDFETITGYQNLSMALGRRLQTTLGSLLYHSDYGSRIPPEVGMVQDTATAGHIAAYGQSAILSDPRVQAVLNSTATLVPGSGVQFSATAQPIGIGSTPTSVNQVITSPVQG